MPPRTASARGSAIDSWLRTLTLTPLQTALLLAYFTAWVILPPLLIHSLPLDVVESINWGREWQWGYYKHPPLPAWLLYLFYSSLGRYGPFLLSQLCILLTLAYVYKLGCRLMPPARAAVGTLLLLGVYYYGWPTLEFNHNLAQLPIWAALGYHAFAALQDNRLRQWITLGLWFGIGMLTKYSVAVMIMVLLLYLLLSPFRRLLRSPGPWIATAVGLLLFAPHLYWLTRHDWLPLQYASERAHDGGAMVVVYVLELLGAQALAHLPMLVVIAAARPWRATASPELRSYRLLTPHASYLWTIALAPIAFISVLSLVTGKDLRQMWASPMWNFSGLLAVALLPANWLPKHTAGVVRGTLMWLLLATLLMAGYLGFGAQLRGKASRMDWPAAAIASQAQYSWNSRSVCPLDVVAGDYWTAGLVAHRTHPAPSVLIEGDPRYSPWVDAERLQQHGALWLWHITDGEQPAAPGLLAVLDNNPNISIHQGRWTVPWPFAARKLQPLQIGWRAYIPVACLRPLS